MEMKDVDQKTDYAIGYARACQQPANNAETENGHSFIGSLLRLHFLDHVWTVLGDECSRSADGRG